MKITTKQLKQLIKEEVQKITESDIGENWELTRCEDDLNDCRRQGQKYADQLYEIQYALGKYGEDTLDGLDTGAKRDSWREDIAEFLDSIREKIGDIARMLDY